MDLNHRLSLQRRSGATARCLSLLGQPPKLLAEDPGVEPGRFVFDAWRVSSALAYRPPHPLQCVTVQPHHLLISKNLTVNSGTHSRNYQSDLVRGAGLEPASVQLRRLVPNPLGHPRVKLGTLGWI